MGMGPCRSRRRDATIAYFGTGLGVTVGFHRHFTHKSFKAVRPLKVALAITGSLASRAAS
jgi:stearoyl-CoA desaturase (delta-9 desaturase)